MGRVIFAIEPGVIESSMAMPEDLHIVDALWNSASGTINLVVESKNIPDSTPGGIAMMRRVTPSIEVETDRDDRVISKKFSLNL